MIKKQKLLLLFLVFINIGVAYAAQPAKSLNLTLQGTVAPYCYFTINSVSSSTGTPIPQTSASLTFASATEIPTSGLIYCNDSAGYTVTASSKNNGVFKSTTGQTINYQVDVGTGAVDITKTPTQLYSFNSLSTPLVGVSQNIQIDYPGGAPANQVLAGTYSDTITFTLMGN